MCKPTHCIREISFSFSLSSSACTPTHVSRPRCASRLGMSWRTCPRTRPARTCFAQHRAISPAADRRARENGLQKGAMPEKQKDRPPSARSSKSRRFPNCQKVSDSALSGQRRSAPSRRTLYRAPRRRIQYRCMYSIPVHGTGSMQISSSGTGWLRSSRDIIASAVAPILRARACAERIVMRVCVHTLSSVECGLGFRV